MPDDYSNILKFERPETDKPTSALEEFHAELKAKGAPYNDLFFDALWVMGAPVWNDLKEPGE